MSIQDLKKQLFKAKAENKNRIALTQYENAIQKHIQNIYQDNKPQTIKVLIDMQAVQGLSRFRGLGRFARSFVKAMFNTKGCNDVHLLFNERLGKEFVEEFESIVGKDHLHFFDAGVATAAVNPHLTFNLPVAKAAYRAKVAEINPDILHLPSFFEGYGDDSVMDATEYPGGWKVVVTLHDLIPYVLQKEYLDGYPSYKEHYLSVIEEFKQIKHFVSISEHSRKEAHELLGIPLDNIINCSSDVDPDFINTIPNADVLQKYNITKKYILYTGGDDVRKNLPRLVEAFCLLPRHIRNEYQLVIAGPMEKDNAHQLHGLYRQYVEKHEVKMLKFISNEDLASLYKHASLFVFPSYSEGFGLPLIEAMRFGVPLICSNCSVMPEVVEYELCYFDPHSLDSIKQKMIEVLTNPDLQQRIVNHGKQQALKFSWNATANKTWAVYCSLFGKAHSSQYTKQLLVDISELVKRDAKTGIQRVTRSILKELLTNPPQGYTVKAVYADTQRMGYYYANTFTSQFLDTELVYNDDPVIVHKNDIFLGLDLSQPVVQYQQPIYEAMHKQGVKIFFVAHDILPITHLLYFDGATESPRLAHEAWLKTATSYDGVICVSHFTAGEIRKWCTSRNINTNVPLFVSWNGYDIDQSHPSTGISQRQQNTMDTCFSKPTLLIVGTIEPRKGHIDVINTIQQHNMNILIVGKEGWMVEDVIDAIRTNPLLNKRLFWIHDASDECLSECYKKAEGVLVPSYVEGFGLPIVEAAAYNKSLILRDIPVFRELAQDKATYFNDVSDLGHTINTWSSLEIKPSPSCVPLLTWKESTEKLLGYIL